MGLRDIFGQVVKTLMGKGEEGYVPPAAMPRVEPPTPTLVALQDVPLVDEPVTREDMPLSRRFTLFQMTATNCAQYQKRNRVMTVAEVNKLREVANLAEIACDIWGMDADIHSGRRCPTLNDAIPGSSRTSQHMKCEAVDLSPKGPDTRESTEAAFEKLRQAARQGKIKFGQLIVESAARDYGRAYWIHLSLGRPYRDAARCGEVMRAERKADGSTEYVLLERIA